MFSMFGHRLFFFLLGVWLCGVIYSPPVAADKFLVNSTADTVDQDIFDGVCADSFGNCTLRAAVQQANVNPGVDIIGLPAGTYNLDIVGADDLAASGDLDILRNLKIIGEGAESTIIDGSGTGERIFQVGHSLLTGISLALSSVTLRNANSTAQEGAAIRNFGALLLQDSTLSNNATDSSGGAIFNTGTAVLERCTLQANNATANGGGIYNGDGAVLAASNVTVSGNTAGSGGGGIYNFSTASLTLANLTVAANTAVTGGGLFAGGTETVKNTIIANNTGSDCSNTIDIESFSLDSDASCGFAAALSQVDPLLDVLANNGGSTQTHALLSGSPAIDAGDIAGCTDAAGSVLTEDQRRAVRPVDGNLDSVAVCDIGAFELGSGMDLTITNVHLSDCVDTGKNISYTLTVTNGGSDIASGITIIDTFVGDITFGTVTPENAGCGFSDARTVSCTLGSLAPGATETIIVTATANSAGMVTSTATVSSSALDPFPSNNTSEARTLINCAPKCFVATAAFGSPMAQEIKYLRQFRDQYLLTNWAGRLFVDLYNKYGPMLADYIRGSELLRSLVRAGLIPAVRLSAWVVEESAPDPD